MTPRRKKGLVLVALGLGGLAAWGWAPRLVHDLQMWRYQRAAASIPLTEGLVVGSAATFGHLWGGSNHCDAEVWVLVESAAEPARFAESLPARHTLPALFDGVLRPGEEPWRPADSLWRVSPSGEVFQVRTDGRLVALGPTGEVLDPSGQVSGLEQVELASLRALAAAHPARDGHLYALQATDQSYRAFDLRDGRCR